MSVHLWTELNDDFALTHIKAWSRGRTEPTQLAPLGGSPRHRRGIFVSAQALQPSCEHAVDIGVPIVLIWYWFTFLRDVGGMMRSPPPRPSRYRSITRIDDGNLHRGQNG